MVQNNWNIPLTRSSSQLFTASRNEHNRVENTSCVVEVYVRDDARSTDHYRKINLDQVFCHQFFLSAGDVIIILKMGTAGIVFVNNS